MSKKSKRILALLNDPRQRERMLQSLNRENMDDLGPVGGKEQGMKILSEMNELDQLREQSIRDGIPKINIL